ncbi:MAG TPA: ABC transporter ATP-binding protein [Acidimicrobiales bacterium]
MSTGLEIEGLTVRFGGLVAVDGLSLAAPSGSITGLIGPNGAGKSTTFNACCGVVRPAEGRILLDGRDLAGVSVSGRARLGLGRTFQQMELFESLPVRVNVALGREGALAGRSPLSHVLSRRSERNAIEAAADAAVEACELSEVADRPVQELSTGQRRLVELARALAGQYRFLLLDEPSSGLDTHETRRFAEVVERAVDEHGVGVLMVEHDMDLVLSSCSHIHVIDFGRPLFQGTPDEVRSSEIVRAAYLGTEVVV